MVYCAAAVAAAAAAIVRPMNPVNSISFRQCTVHGGRDIVILLLYRYACTLSRGKRDAKFSLYGHRA